jgi:NAD(P)-dependent dehydrogenase (short-subunit alcohol dehydrogenase family)
VYVVFGAAGGIGAALVQRLSGQQGAKVVQVDDARAGDLQGEVHQADASDFKQVEKVLKQVRDQYEHVHGVANCIGDASIMKPIHITSEDEYEHTMRTNVKTAFNILKASVPVMMSEGGSIVLATAAISHMGAANHDIVAAAKGAVSSLAVSAASTYSPHNIRINCVAPGLIRTPMTESMTDAKQAKDASLKMIPLGRFGEPDEAAAAFEFLMHPSNSFITAQTLMVDGGLGTIRPTTMDNEPARSQHDN